MKQCYRVPACISNGGFSSEKIYRIKLANGCEFEGIGFSHHMWQGEKPIQDELDSEIDGHVMVYLLAPIHDDTAIVEPPQLHNVDYQGPIMVRKDDLVKVD